MYALNSITDTGVFCGELCDFFHQHSTHNIDWPTFKKFGPLFGQNKNITDILWGMQHIPTLQQMMTLSPLSKLLWPTLLLNMPNAMLQ